METREKYTFCFSEFVFRSYLQGMETFPRNLEGYTDDDIPILPTRHGNLSEYVPVCQDDIIPILPTRHGNIYGMKTAES